LLSTALVKVKDASGIERVCRAMLDNGSQSSFITEATAKSLGLRREQANVNVTGISSTSLGTARGRVKFRVTSCLQDESIEVEALILPTVTGTLPTYPCNPEDWPHVEELQLADPTFHKPGAVDILLGADITYSVMRDGIRFGGKNTPIAHNTVFGWVLGGTIKPSPRTLRPCAPYHL
jgi:hypothetical protein